MSKQVKALVSIASIVIEYKCGHNTIESYRVEKIVEDCAKAFGEYVTLGDRLSAMTELFKNYCSKVGD